MITFLSSFNRTLKTHVLFLLLKKFKKNDLHLLYVLKLIAGSTSGGDAVYEFVDF